MRGSLGSAKGEEPIACGDCHVQVPMNASVSAAITNLCISHVHKKSSSFLGKHTLLQSAGLRDTSCFPTAFQSLPLIAAVHIRFRGDISWSADCHLSFHRVIFLLLFSLSDQTALLFNLQFSDLFSPIEIGSKTICGSQPHQAKSPRHLPLTAMPGHCQ